MANVGVGVMIYNNNKLLMIKRSGSHGSGTWSTPGGHIEFSESPFDCAKREAYEETGVHIKNCRFLGFTNDVFSEGKHYITLWVAAEYDSGVVCVHSKRELTEVGWFSLDNLPSPLFKSMENYLAGGLITTHTIDL